jgi:hypothetical protein
VAIRSRAGYKPSHALAFHMNFTAFVLSRHVSSITRSATGCVMRTRAMSATQHAIRMAVREVRQENHF